MCTIWVWNAHTNAELLLKIDAHQLSVQSVVWSPDGQQLVSASEDKTVKFWNSLNGDQIGLPCTGHTDSIGSLAISSDGSFIAIASLDNTVHLWSTNTHQQISLELQHTAWALCVAISSNRTLLASGDYDGKVFLWPIRRILEQHQVQERLNERDDLMQRCLIVDTYPPPSESNIHIPEGSNSFSADALFDTPATPPENKEVEDPREHQDEESDEDVDPLDVSPV
ncbi:WD40-repeat-containing domain protein [Suillus subluteus]|nr:WD40-repeat-containing domain protein [Suillus subluteus]